MQYSPKGFQDIVSKAKMAPAQLQSPLNFADGGLIYDGQSQINDMMANPSGFSGMSNQLNMATGGMVQSKELMQEPLQGLPQYYPVSGEPIQQQSPFATGLMPQDTPPLTPPVAPPSISTPYPARVMGSFSNSPGSNSIAPPLSSVDQTKTIADPALVPAPTISPVAMAHGGAVGGRMASTMKSEFSKRGLDFDKYMAKRLAAKGHNGDTMLAHINPSEAQMLKQAGGSGTINPDTGLSEFYRSGGDSSYNSDTDSFKANTSSDNYNSTNYGGLYGGGNGSPNPSSSSTSGSDKGNAQEVLDRVTDQTQTPLEKQIADDFINTARQTGYVNPAQKLAMEQQQQEQQQELALERDQEAQRVQQENLTRAYQQMAMSKQQGPLSTFGNGSDILKSGSFTGSPGAVPIDDRIRPMPKDAERTWGDTASDALDTFKSGASSVYDALGNGMSAIDQYMRAPSVGPQSISQGSISNSANLNPDKLQERALVDYAGFDPIRSPVTTEISPLNATNASAPLPPVRDDMSTQAAAPVETTVKPPIDLSDYANASQKKPAAPPAAAPPAATSLKKEETWFGSILDDVINNPLKLGVDVASNFNPLTALYNLGGKALGYNSLGQSIQNLTNGQGAFDNPPEGFLTDLIGGANASSPNQNMLTYDPVASYQNGVQFIPETTMGYGPYGNLTREEYQKQYGGRDVPVIPINTTPKTPTTPTTPDTTTPDTPTNGLGLATYDPRTYLGGVKDPLTYGFGGEQVYYKAMGGAVGPLSQKRK